MRAAAPGAKLPPPVEQVLGSRTGGDPIDKRLTPIVERIWVEVEARDGDPAPADRALETIDEALRWHGNEAAPFIRGQQPMSDLPAFERLAEAVLDAMHGN